MTIFIQQTTKTEPSYTILQATRDAVWIASGVNFNVLWRVGDVMGLSTYLITRNHADAWRREIF